MNVSLYQAAAALDSNSRWQEKIAENLASSSIPGFKKQDLSFSAVEAGLAPTPAGAPPQHFLLPTAVASTNFKSGDLKYTGAKTDLAIEGEGFFEVQLAFGGSAYTRDGEFHVNSQGQLVTKQGYLVMGEAGPIQIDLSNPTPVTISATGEVSQGSDIKGKVRLVGFEDPKSLTQISGGYFQARDPYIRTADVSGSALHQGYLETANTSSVAEMANLMSAMRLFEANQKVVQVQDERMGRAISELGNVS